MAFTMLPLQVFAVGEGGGSDAKINSSNKYILDIKEYEIYGKYGHRESYKGIDSGKGTSKLVTDNNKTMMVQKTIKLYMKVNLKMMLQV